MKPQLILILLIKHGYAREDPLTDSDLWNNADEHLVSDHTIHQQSRLWKCYVTTFKWSAV